jgi:hypothetical protein
MPDFPGVLSIQNISIAGEGGMYSSKNISKE